jgi:hypothetical protein
MRAMTTRMTTRTSTTTDVRPDRGPAPVAEVPVQVGRGADATGGVASPGPVRPAPPWAPSVPGLPTRPAGRRDARRPAGRPGALVTPLVRPVPASARVGRDGFARAHARAVVLRRRRTVATVVLGVVLLGLVVLAVRLGGAATGDVPSGPVPAGSAVVVVAPGETLIDVAHRAAPGADTDALVARIRTDNHLSGSTVTPGRPLVVPAGS